MSSQGGVFLKRDDLPDGWGDSVALQSFLRLKKSVLGSESPSGRSSASPSPLRASAHYPPAAPIHEPLGTMKFSELRHAPHGIPKTPSSSSVGATTHSRMPGMSGAEEEKFGGTGMMGVGFGLGLDSPVAADPLRALDPRYEESNSPSLRSLLRTSLHEKLQMQRMAQAAVDEKKTLEEQVMKLQHRIRQLEMGFEESDHDRRVKNAYNVMKRLVHRELATGFQTWKQKAFPVIMEVESEASKLIKIEAHRTAQENALHVLRRWHNIPLANAFQHMRWYSFVYTRKQDDLRHKKSLARKIILRLLNQKVFAAFNDWRSRIHDAVLAEEKQKRVEHRVKGALNRMYFDRIRIGWSRWCRLIRNIKLQEKVMQKIIDCATNAAIGDTASAFRRWYNVVYLQRSDRLQEKLKEAQRMNEMAEMSKLETYQNMCGVLLKFMIGRTFMRMTMRAWMRWMNHTASHRAWEMDQAAKNQIMSLRNAADLTDQELEKREREAQEKHAQELAYMRSLGEEAEAKWLQEQHEKNLQKNLILNLLNCQLRPAFNQWRDASRAIAEEERLMEVRIQRAKRVVVNWLHREMRPPFNSWVNHTRETRRIEEKKKGMIKTARGVIQRWFRGELSWGWQRWIKVAQQTGKEEFKMRRCVRQMCQKKLRAGWNKWREVSRHAQLIELRAAKLLEPIMKRNVDYLRLSHSVSLWQKNVFIKKRQRRVITRLLQSWLSKGFRKWREVAGADRMGRMVIRAVCRRMIAVADMSIQKAFALWVAHGQSQESAETIRKNRIKRTKVAILGWLHRELHGPFAQWKRYSQEMKRKEHTMDHSMRVARTVIQRWVKGELAWGFQRWYKCTVWANQEHIKIHSKTRMYLLNMKAKGMCCDKLSQVSRGWQLRRMRRAFLSVRAVATTRGRAHRIVNQVFRMWSTVKVRLLMDSFSRWKIISVRLGLEEDGDRRARNAGNFGLLATKKLRHASLKRRTFAAWRDFVRPTRRIANGKIALGLSDLSLISSHLCRTAQDASTIQFLSTASSALKYSLSIDPITGDFARVPRHTSNTPVVRGTSRLTAVVYVFLSGKASEEATRAYGELHSSDPPNPPVDPRDPLSGFGLRASPQKPTDGRGGGPYNLDVDLSGGSPEKPAQHSHHDALHSSTSQRTSAGITGLGGSERFQPSLFCCEEVRAEPVDVVQGRRTTHRPRRVLLNEGLVGRCAASGQVKLLMRSRGAAGYASASAFSSYTETDYGIDEWDGGSSSFERGRGAGGSSSSRGEDRGRSPSGRVRFAPGTAGAAGTPPPPTSRRPRTAMDRGSSSSPSPPPRSRGGVPGSMRARPPSSSSAPMGGDKIIWDTSADDGLSHSERSQLGLTGRNRGDSRDQREEDMQLIAAAVPLWWKGRLVGVVSYECESWMAGVTDAAEHSYGIYELNRSLYFNSRDATKRSAFGPLARSHLSTLQEMVGQTHLHTTHTPLVDSQAGTSGTHPGLGLGLPGSPGGWSFLEASVLEEHAHVGNGAELIDGLFDDVAATNASDVWNWSFVQMCELFGMHEHQVAMCRSLADPISASLSFLKSYHSLEEGVSHSHLHGTEATHGDVALSSIFRISGIAERSRLLAKLNEKEARSTDNSNDIATLKSRIEHLEKSRMKHFEASKKTSENLAHTSAELKRVSAELARYQEMVVALQRQQAEVDAIHASLKEVTATVLQNEVQAPQLPVVLEDEDEDEGDGSTAPPPIQTMPRRQSRRESYRAASSMGSGKGGQRGGYRDSISLLYGKDSIADLYSST